MRAGRREKARLRQHNRSQQRKMGPLKVLLLYGFVSVASCQLRLDVALGRNVTLNCTHRKGVQWEIIGGVNSSLTIYLSHVPPETKEMGIILLTPQMVGNAKVNRLRVLGSIQNNQTEIKCTESGNGSVIIASYILTVIGPPERVGEVRGWVEEFSPPRLRLEWEEPFSQTHHPILHYTLYTREGATATTSTSSVTFGLKDVEFSSNCTHSADSIRVAAVNDIGESEPSPVVSMWRDATGKEVEIVDGKLYPENELSMFDLVIKFPRLCEGQEMSVRVEVEEERTGDLVYSDTRHSEYRGGDPVDYSINISPLLTDGYYTVLVHLTTGGHNTSSLPLRLLMSGGGKESSEIENGGIGAQGNTSNTDILLSVIVVLTAVVICFLVVAVVVGAVLVKNKFFSGSREAKENENPIYEGPLYENMEESRPRSLSSLPPPLSARRRGSGGCVSSAAGNLYTSSLPVPIPTALETTQQGTLLTPKTQPQEDTPGPGEDDTYTVMSPAGHAARGGYSFTPYMEDRAAWISNRK